MNDLIRREDAMEAVWKPQVKPNELIFDALKRAIESEINNLPSADRPQDDCETCEHYNNIGDWCRTCGVSHWHPRMKGVDDE